MVLLIDDLGFEGIEAEVKVVDDVRRDEVGETERSVATGGGGVGSVGKSDGLREVVDRLPRVATEHTDLLAQDVIDAPEGGVRVHSGRQIAVPVDRIGKGESIDVEVGWVLVREDLGRDGIDWNDIVQIRSVSHRIIELLVRFILWIC